MTDDLRFLSPKLNVLQDTFAERIRPIVAQGIALKVVPAEEIKNCWFSFCEENQTALNEAYDEQEALEQLAKLKETT